MPKKCPACNSTRYTYSNKAYQCARCGYINKSTQQINKELKEKTNKKNH